MNLIKIAKAAENAVVGCQGSNCTVCSVLETVNNVYNFITGISFAVAVLFLTLAGLIYIFGTGRKAYFLKAKNFARNAVLGFIFILVGWIAIQAVLYSTGYKNAGSWWQFRCDIADNGSGNETAGSLKTFSDLTGFILSGEEKAIVKGPLSQDRFLAQLKALKSGEKFAFYFRAKKNFGDQAEILVPFLAGYKDVNTGQIKIDSGTPNFMKTLAAALAANPATDSSTNSAAGSVPAGAANATSGLVSLLGSSGNSLSSQQSLDLMKKLTVALLQSFSQSSKDSSFVNLLGSSGAFTAADLQGASLDNLIAATRQEIVRLSQQSPPTGSNDAFGKALALATESALQTTDLVVGTGSTDLSGLASISGGAATGTSRTVGGDSTGVGTAADSDSTSTGDRAAVSDNWTSSTSSGFTPQPYGKVTEAQKEAEAIRRATPGPSAPMDPSTWQKTLTADKAPPGSQTDNIIDQITAGRNDNEIDQIKDQIDKENEKRKNDNVEPLDNDFEQGDGSPRAIERALKRLCKRDSKRYEMVFRSVQHIGDQPGGGLCTGCGDIYVTHDQKIFDITHILVHEATHAGHDCVVGWGGFQIDEIEAIACANQKGASPLTKSPSMTEFTKARKQKIEVRENGVAEVRGHLYRYWKNVSPNGDLPTDIVDGIFQFTTDYPKSYGYPNEGQYKYGWGDSKNYEPKEGKNAEDLRLPDKLENVVKKVMEDDSEYKSCPTQWLIDQKCPTEKKCNAATIQID